MNFLSFLFSGKKFYYNITSSKETDRTLQVMWG